MAFSVRAVENRRDLKTFIRLPYRLYRHDKLWVPPLLSEERKKFLAKSNPILQHCDFELFLLYEDGKPVGRISAFVDWAAVNFWKARIGLFGSYECIDNPVGSALLLDAARKWLKLRGMERMRGPWSFTSQEWGSVVKGFDSPPSIMSPYNPPYYNREMEAFGLKKAKDLLVYELDTRQGYELPEDFLKWTDWIARKNKVTIRHLNMNRLEEDVKTIVDVANESTKANWGYVPATDAEAHDIAQSLKPIVDPEIVMIAEIEGRAVGYLIALPDVNTILKDLHGRLFPFGFLRLLSGLKKIRQYRIWGMGVIPQYHRKAMDALFYRKLYEVLRKKNPTRVEANYVLEDNVMMNNPILRLGFKESKRYRVYEMAI
ncbi:hypothetical protein AMJ44_10160 [candidate division WOR-1 bacterium DG_54_3]|uniref:N-acetyltransferase domain-containing protein n=1 Tax=candidate division WOR-1 bacterium DG_54_3 TaxID=1703775 RepID=A0A0S7XSV5_UNCSA|nr:MAG: hypothetical protein AMJ44_10160 [candidate division WOR-1 bacterium DG_54_3]